MSAFLGGFAITFIGWAGPNAVDVRFTTAETGWLYQLYAGRTRIASTSLSTERRLVGQLVPDDTPTPLTIVRVSVADRLTDFGPQLPKWPWNRFSLDWTATGYPADTRYWDILASPTAGAAVDADNLVGRVLFAGDGDYQFHAPPVGSSGVWTYRVTPRDQTWPDGNAGDAAEVAVTALVPPKDVTEDSDGNRFTLASTAGNLIAEFAY
ncbi:MAG: hypothetical protein A3E01_10760 [Gammaproteobacteria bacterium RIFCSPHIGHO2_12_FULL_63_22]|nr:MAG: hypothetical protein A3E01_10760 [Gammaproteobacteria bacterium RIFCSPHIGHO2_12_FULL_63_22]